MSNPISQLVALPKEFLQSALSDLKTSVDEIASTDKQALLDAKPVERFDGASLQFLIAFANSGISASPCVTNISMNLVTALQDIGISREYISSNFGLPVDSTEAA